MARNGTIRGLRVDLLKMVMEAPSMPTTAPHGLPADIASVVKTCQLDLTPKASRQLDSLVRKRLGVADPKPEPVDDATRQVIQLADRIVRASVAADIQRIQKGPRS